MVFLSGFLMNRIGITDFAIAMVFLGGFVVDRIGIANFAIHGGSGGGDVSQFSVRYEYLLLARPTKVRR